MQTFEENKPIVTEKKSSAKNKYHTAPYLNECYYCHKKPGRKFDMDVMTVLSVFLYVDVRGYAVCNFCKEKGLLMKERKMTKKEKKNFKKMQRELGAFSKVESITLDAKGNVVT